MTLSKPLTTVVGETVCIVFDSSRGENCCTNLGYSYWDVISVVMLILKV